ncbi:ACT domain repeat 5 [Striga asiatica]|uniref:ACT domain repeat 5 n=1 Tax=Striga asiatica TaxID=4170 RepID=A0A5A7P470_STRAF|nr:ACT domain repeat 5 [Striga asiatica]
MIGFLPENICRLPLDSLNGFAQLIATPVPGEEQSPQLLEHSSFKSSHNTSIFSSSSSGKLVLTLPGFHKLRWAATEAATRRHRQPLEKDTGFRQPFLSPDKPTNRKLLRFTLAELNLHPSPLNPPTRIRSRARITIFSIENRVRAGPGRIPCQPSFRVDRPVYIRLHENDRRVIPPRPPQKCVGPTKTFFPGGSDRAVVHRKARVFVRVGFSLGRYYVCSSGGRVLEEYEARLDDGSRVSEYEVHCPDYGAFAVELSFGVHVECVLFALDEALEEDRFVRGRE